MNVDESMKDAWEAMQRKLGRIRDEPELVLHGGGGGGTSGGMEARVAKLEAHLEHVRGDLAELKPVPKDLGVLKEKVSHLPTKGWMVGSVITSLAVVGGLITFSDRLQALVT